MRNLICMLVLAGMSGVAAGQTLLLHEPFNYDATGNPELPTANPTDYGKIGTSVAPKVFEGSLSYPNPLPWAPSGNSLKIDGTGPTSSATREITPGRVSPFGGAGYHGSEGLTLYYSMLLKVNVIMGADFNSAGAFVAGFRSVTGTGAHQNQQAGAPLLIRAHDVGRTAYNLGTSVTALNGRTWDETAYTADQTLLVVFAYDFNTDGPHAARMWVNPDPTKSEEDNLSARRLEVLSSDTISMIANNRITNFFFRNNQASADDVQMDELRVSLAWESVLGLQDGDFNRDGVVDLDDQALLYAGFSQGLSGYGNGDYNRDGRIDYDDLALFDRALATAASPPAGLMAAVPEPGAAAIFGGLAMSGLLGRRRAR